MKSKNSLHLTVFEIRKIVSIEYYATNLFFLSGVGVALNSCSKMLPPPKKDIVPEML